MLGIRSKPEEDKTERDKHPYKYLLDKIGDKEVKVYKDLTPVIPYSNPSYNSFKEETATPIKYSKFIEEMSQYS